MDEGIVRHHVLDIYERSELAQCWYSDEGDCGNWPICDLLSCPLRALGALVGIVPQQDGGVDKQQFEAAEPRKEQP